MQNQMFFSLKETLESLGRRKEGKTSEIVNIEGRELFWRSFCSMKGWRACSPQ